jgi:probable rRNA maturation factor
LVILEKKVAGLTEVAFSRFLLRARKAAGLKGTVHVLVTSSAAMRSLNLRFRRKNKPTDVLSFPAAEPTKGGQRFAGEIAISADIAAQNALRLGHSLAAEIKVLALHGVLHLAGFDHERDNGVMRRRETQLRLLLRLPESLIERGQPAAITPGPSRERRKKRRPA